MALVLVTKYECVTELYQYSLNGHIKQPEKYLVQNLNNVSVMTAPIKKEIQKMEYISLKEWRQIP